MTGTGSRSTSLRRWGLFVARRAWLIIVGWVVLILAGFGVAGGAFGNDSLFSRVTNGEIVVSGENRDGRDLLASTGQSGFSRYTLTLRGVDLASPDVAAAAQDAAGRLRSVDTVTAVANPYVLPGGISSPEALAYVKDADVASGGFATVVTFDTKNTAEEEAAATAQVDEIFDDLETATGATSSERGGLRTLVNRIIDQIKIDGQRGEGIALPLSFIVMLIVFGGFLAAGFPVVGAIASISGALASLLAFSYWFELDASVINVVTVLALGLCIDYGLLTVSRFREELRLASAGSGSSAGSADSADLDRATIAEAVAATMDRAGRTVVFSAITVAVSLGGMLAFDIELVRAVALAGVSVVVLALAVALSLVPALCTVAGRRLVRRRTEDSGDDGVFAALARRVHRMPWVVITLVSGLLILLSLPAGSMVLTGSGPELLPKGTPERTFFEDFREDYPLLSGAEVSVVTRESAEEVQAWAATAASRPGVKSVDPVVTLDGGVVVAGFQTGDSGTGANSRALTESLRSDRPPFDADIVGQASAAMDFRSAVASRAPLAIGAVVLATLILLFLMTGSVVIPMKALVMNVLSLGASLGLTVWIFQNGHLESVLRFTSTGGVETIVPVLVLAFGFGLSMDYEVFLLSRIVELHEQGHDTETAVTLGLQRSGRIITSAALLMIIVFGGFAAGEMLMIKELGVALVLAIGLDATLVRMLLVPATMSALGQINWWAPAPLRRLHERWGITE